MKGSLRGNSEAISRELLEGISEGMPKKVEVILETALGRFPDGISEQIMNSPGRNSEGNPSGILARTPGVIVDKLPERTWKEFLRESQDELLGGLLVELRSKYLEFSVKLR